MGWLVQGVYNYSGEILDVISPAKVLQKLHSDILKFESIASGSIDLKFSKMVVILAQKD